MATQIEAVFEDGVLRPLEPLKLADRQRVTLTISAENGSPDDVHFALPTGRWDEFCTALDAPPRVIPALRKLLTAPGVFDGPDPAAR